MAFQDENGRRGLAREMGLLAAEVAADGEKRLAPERHVEKYMQRLPGLIARAQAQTDMDALRILAESARTLQACARRARLEDSGRLPACGDMPRVSLIAARLISGGDRSPGGADMQLALAAFDELQGLTMAEYRAFPQALRIAACNAAAESAKHILDATDEYVCARKWVDNGGAAGDISGRGPAFFERALQLAMELEKPDLRLRLENALARRDSSPELAVRRAQERRALAQMRISNLLGLVRTLEAVNWQKAFENSSRTEAELRRDPSGVYARMAPGSREAVRRQLAVIAKRLGVGETTAARYAVNAAREAVPGDVRRCVAWWIYDDGGRRALARRLGAKRRLPMLTPDPHGYGVMLVQTALAAAASFFLARACGSIWWMLLLFAPVWGLVSHALAQMITRVLRPRAVLRMDFEKLPDEARTLVAIPALLTSPERARSLCRQLETVGCLEKDENLDFVLLGDHPDAATHTCDTDMAVMAAARDEIARMNAAAGREKYHYLHREREYVPADRIWRGRERKRGALMALCRVATGRSRGEFTAEGAAEEHIFGKFRYVVTLDADTKLLPGTAHALAGTIAHPLNAAGFDGLSRRGFAVMQPRVELDAKECTNNFIRLFAGAGGMSTYSGMASDMYHDLTGTGAYCGKAVIDMPAFLDCVEGKLDTQRILSHDFIEGALAGAGYVNDISLFDGFPADYQKWLARLARWTRGDWQLIPDMARGDIPLLARFRMLSNLIDSLREAAVLMLFIFGVWLGNVSAFALGLALMVAMPIAARLTGDKKALTRACMELASLPAAAYARLDAIFRAVYRTFVSRRRLMEWVTSADAGGDANIVKTGCRAAAILLLPGLISAAWFAPSVALILLFLAAPGMLAELADTPASRRQTLDAEHKAALADIARDTWRYFERYVTAAGNYLPPDNVQLDPGPAEARRTSPTNIAMYMLSCVCARDMGFIDGGELRARLSDTLNTLDCMEKWHGHIYNWYDIDTLEILRPAYVSAVDSGNLAAALLACANACGDGALALRLRAFAGNMDLGALYDSDRHLFHIGADIENARLSASYYDLLASESRILSYAALMLGQIPMKHWRALGRPASEGVLMSWSGTMFEYLMPALIMPSAPGTLLCRTYEGVAEAQMKYAAARSRPWGVSESGYHAFDLQMNYQYRAFGMRALSMSGSVAQDVVAPYAACLGLMVRPEDATRNILDMRDRGWVGECGLYEAADFVRAEPRLVKSWMAHHQGMALCAIANVLAGNRLHAYFMGDPRARALELLLNERAAPRIRLKSVPDTADENGRPAPGHGIRRGRTDTALIDSTLLGGGEGAAFITSRGDVAYSRRGILANRFTGDLLRRHDTMFTCIVDQTGAVKYINSAGSKVRFGPGEAVFSAAAGDVSAEMRLCVSPEDGALVKLVRLENAGDTPARLKIMDGFEAALMDMGELRSHPAFHRLFIRADLSRENAVVLRRRPRESDGPERALFHACAGGGCARETDWLRLMGRENTLNADFAGRDGALIDPCSALCMDVTLPAGGKHELTFAVGICESENAMKLAARYSDMDSARRALSLAGSYACSAAAFAGLDDEKRILAERALALLVDPRLLRRSGLGASPAAPGEHSDLPTVCVILDSPGGLDVLRDAVRMHEFMRSMGFAYQLSVIDDHAAGYERPVTDGIQELIGSTHLRDMCFARGGVNIYAANALAEDRRMAIVRASALTFDGRSGYWAQLRRSLMGLQYSAPGVCDPVSISPENTGFTPGSLAKDAYEFDIAAGCLPSAPWSNIIMAESVGMLVTERGGGFIWHRNSRLRRVTNFDNDPAHEGWGCMLYVADRKGRFLRALPGDVPLTAFHVRHGLSETVFTTKTDELMLETAIFPDHEADELIFSLEIKNLTRRPLELRAAGFVDWLMGADASDAARTRAWNHNGALLAAGALDGVAYFACDLDEAEICPPRSLFLGRGGVMRPDGLMNRGDGGCALAGDIAVPAESARRGVFRMGIADDAAKAAARSAMHTDVRKARDDARLRWEDMRRRMETETGDEKLDDLANGFLLKQVLDGRVRARAGFYQAGGAYGFRDQLQDMLALLPYEPDMVRGHILMCAARQFEDGDVMHWWHPPMTGVRTRISDDMLFLPFVTAQYVRATGDTGILDETVSYLENVPIPEGREDWYGEARESMARDTLREHCLKALRRAYRKGAHGLLLMGAGDWNDGMNRIGNEGRGESVWLSMFFSACARGFAEFVTDEGDRAWLLDAARDQLDAVMESGWDGGWFLRAYDDDGGRVGSADNDQCRIDLISQAWSALSGCAPARVGQAMDAAWSELYDGEHEILKLLTPPFTGKGSDPGYIAAYPPGVRENGGQYTHAACWYLAALAAVGDGRRAKALLHALMPVSHAEKEPDTYRVEPYVLAGDVYGEGAYAGRGGWTWYTGSAGWLLCAVRMLMGYERRGDKLRVNALEGVWDKPCIKLAYGKAKYIVFSDRDAENVTLDDRPVSGDYITLTDDGREHVCVFPQRRGAHPDILSCI